MSDRKPPLDLGLEDLDWDAAIAEWEESSFLAEVAPDTNTQVHKAPTPIAPPRPAASPPAARSKAPDSPASTQRGATAGSPNARGGLGQLFKSGRTPMDTVREAELSETLDRDLAAAPPRQASAQTASTLANIATEETLSATITESGDDAIDQLLSATDEMPSLEDAATFANLPRPDDDEPTQYIKRMPPRPLPEPASDLHEADMDAATVSRRSPSAQASSDLPAAEPPPEAAQVRPYVRRHDQDAPTRTLQRSAFPATRSPDAAEEEAPPPPVFEDEQPARDVLNDDARRGLLERARWFESEARAMHDPRLGAQTRLTASELYAMCGSTEDATRVAMEAREIEPRLGLAHWQARALLPRGMDVASVITALDAESRHATAPAHRVHALVMSAEHLRAAGQGDDAEDRWDQAARLAPDDARPITARAGRALSTNDYVHPGLAIGKGTALASISLAMGTALRLRGVDGAGGNLGENLANDSLRRARVALEQGDVPTASALLAEVRSVPELARAATWLSAALGATRNETRAAAGVLLRSLIGGDDATARRALAALGVESGDASLAEAAMSDDETFAAPERAVLAALLRLPLPQADADLGAIAEVEGMAPLAAALAAIGVPSALPEKRARAKHTAGTAGSRRVVTLGRLLATDAPEDDIDTALRDAGGEDAARAIALELAARSGRYDAVSAALASWSSTSETAALTRDRNLAAALVAERAGKKDRAREAYHAARSADPACEPAVRALLDVDPAADPGAFLDELATSVEEPLRTALLRLEAIVRGKQDTPTTAASLERVHRAAPSLPFAAFLAERLARRNGNVEDVLRWLRERRSQATDPLEAALDGVREALLVADAEPEIAADRLADAHQARPADVALRELFERLAVEPPTDRGLWREQRAEATNGPSRALLFIEAAFEYERAGDKEGFLRAAQAAQASGDDGLGKIVLERAQLEAGAAARLADELLTRARSTEDENERREAYERLADLDAVGRDDPASALLWHRAILEVEPLYKPSLRYVEHAYITGGRDEELEPIASTIARALAGQPGGECVAHADLAVRLRLRGEGGWDSTRDLSELAGSQTQAPLWALRLMNAHARAAKDHAKILSTALALVPKTSRATELAALHLRAGEAATHLGNVDEARQLLERAANEDPGDIVTWGLLADIRQRSNDVRGAAEAGESLARTSGVPRHQLIAWYDSARIWLDDVGEPDRGVTCLEHAAKLDITYEDVFPRLSALYAQRGSREELAVLLEKRIAIVTSPEEKVDLEVQRGRALVEIGDRDGAQKALKGALAEKPDHVEALGIYGDLCAAQGQWEEAEQAWVRLARALSPSDEQRDVYKKLGELYAVHAVNLSRAEVAFKEVLKRAPNDAHTLERLVNVYARQNDAPRAIEAQQQLLTLSAHPTERRTRTVQLASLYDDVARDARKAEQTLEAARRESPADVSILRALAEFYTRHKQMPAVNILLDRAATDARRALLAGRFAPGSFEVLQAVYDLRGRKDAARVVGATLAAYEGRPSETRGAETRAADPRLDDLLAPELFTPALRALLARTGDALDAAAPLDARGMQAAQLPKSAAALHQTILHLGHQMGIGPVQALVAAKLDRKCLAASSSPPTIVLGENLLSVSNEPARTFLLIRALKLVQVRASAIARTPPSDMAVLMAAWLQAFNPQWRPDGVNAAAIAEASRRLKAGLPRQLAPDVGVIALDVAGSVGTQGAALGAGALFWANRTALLAIGDPTAAFDAIAWSLGANGAPGDGKERAIWASRTNEVKDLIAFSVTDAYAEARGRLGLDRV